jgi:choline dehydrogenase-like flavoprotein
MSDARDSFDYVIVGAGSSGCALARRLSDDPEVTVALIEAGGADDHPYIATPVEYFKLWGTDVDWQYRSVPQPNLGNRVLAMPRGRVLGGTSSINGMVYLRGASSDFERWAEGGCAGWDWETVRGSYEGMEAVLQPAVLGDNNPLSGVFVEAAQQAGLPRSATFDEGALDGAGWNRSSISKGRRHSSYQAFVAPVAGRPNLTVVSETIVERLLIDASGAVSGVETHAFAGGPSRRIGAGEVILCAGAFDSPRLLMLSGIGPVEHLRSVGIEPIVDLPVGDNLIDHLLIGVVYDSTAPISPAHQFVTESCGFSFSSVPRSDTPDIEISFAKEMNFAPPNDDGLPRYTIIPGITQPRSRGTVRLSSSRFTDAPVIDPNYLSHPDDLRMLIDGIHLSREIGRAEALREWCAGEFFPGTETSSDDELTSYIRETVSTWFHPVGTCRMGTGDDAVVRPTLEVLGTTGLRVADASIMPDIVSVNTNAASMMIGWHAADLIGG